MTYKSMNLAAMSRATRIRVALALSAFAIAWPILDILGRNAEFFIARGSSRSEIIAILLLLAGAVPVVASLPAAIPGRFGRIVGEVWLWVLGVALGYLIVRRLDWPWPELLALVFGGAVLIGLLRLEGVRATFAILAWSPIAMAAFFLVATPAGALALDSGAPITAAVDPTETPSIVLLVLDEFPLASLIDPDGNLRADQYPNFARLAADGTWFRNAMTVQQQTEHSVPSIVTGINPARTLNPYAGQYPGSLFTALASAYQMKVDETMTQMCPVTVCTLSPDRVTRGSLANDLGVIAGHILLPPPFTEPLPPIDRNWGSFGAATEDFNAIESFNTARRSDPRGAIERLANSIERSDPELPTFFFTHALLPHNPWQYLPSGQRYPLDSERLPGSNKTGWGENAWLSAQALQRHLLQVQYVDTALGDVIEAMERTGIYDDSLLVVVADHGIALRPDIEHWRQITPDTVGEIAAVPLFVKAPGGAGAGVIDDRRALTVDIVPTIADVLSVVFPWPTEGSSLFAAEPARTETTTVGPQSDATYGVSGTEKLAVAQRNAVWFPTGDPYELLPPQAPDLVGEGESAIESPREDITIRIDRTERFADVDPVADTIPARVTGTVTGLGSSEEVLVAVIVNGEIEAVVQSFHDRGRTGFQAMIPPSSLRAGANVVEAIPFGPGR